MLQKVKGLSLFALTMIAVGATIGSGIFKTPSGIAARVPDPTWIMVLWIMGGVVSLFGALVFAELGSRFPRGGGIYTYLNKAYGSLPSFLYGWCLLTVISSGTIAALCVVFADYLNYFLGMDDSVKPVLAAVSIVVLTLFNTFGLKGSEWFANISTVLKIIGIYGLLILALFLGERAIFSEDVVDMSGGSSTGGGHPLALAFVSVLWSYTGWHYASFVAADAVNPKRTIPLAMIIGTSIVTLTYVLCNLGYMKVLSIEQISSTDVVAADAMQAILPGSGNFVALLIALSVFGCAGLYILSTPRLIYQMASEGLFFRIFATRHKKFGVPVNAIILQSAWAILLVFVWGKFQALIEYVTFMEWLFLLCACAGIFIVRSKKMQKRETTLDGNAEPESASPGFRIPLYPVIPLLFVVIIGWFISQNIISENKTVYAGLLVLPVGAIVYLLFKTLGKKHG